MPGPVLALFEVQLSLPVQCAGTLDWLVVLQNSRLRKVAEHLPDPFRRMAYVAQGWFPRPESVLLFAFPEVNVAPDLRRRYDRSARVGIPPHVTLIYPFLHPDAIDERLLGQLTRFFESVSRFAVRLGAIAGFPGVVYLVPEPREDFVKLVNALAQLYPEAPPYGGIFDSVIPHLTVAESADPHIQDLLVTSAAQMLPIDTEAAEVWLMVRRGRLWKTRARFALGPRAHAQSPALGLHKAVAS
jgi:2'-5' RNA ligase